jgi:GTP-binding protein HflX
LVDAFRATLQEAIDADLLIHVVDAANPDYPEQIAEVQRVLKEIGADAVPQLLVFNKLDALEISQIPLHLSDMYEVDGFDTPRIFVSAQAGAGLPELRAHLASTVQAVLGASDNPEYDPRFGIVES